MRASAFGADDGTPLWHAGDERSEMTPRSKKTVRHVDVAQLLPDAAALPERIGANQKRLLDERPFLFP